MKTMPKTYLGDGVYISHDPNWPQQLVLTAENGISTTNEIFLEPSVQIALVQFLERLIGGKDE